MIEPPVYYCKRIQRSVMVEESGDITGRFYTNCKYDNNKPGKCCFYSSPSEIADFLFPKGLPLRRCVVKLAKQREIKRQMKKN